MSADAGPPLALWGVFPALPPVTRFEPVLDVAEYQRRIGDRVDPGRRQSRRRR